jgi:hypothetical protein
MSPDKPKASASLIKLKLYPRLAPSFTDNEPSASVTIQVAGPVDARTILKAVLLGNGSRTPPVHEVAFDLLPTFVGVNLALRSVPAFFD